MAIQVLARMHNSWKLSWFNHFRSPSGRVLFFLIKYIPTILQDSSQEKRQNKSIKDLFKMFIRLFICNSPKLEQPICLSLVEWRNKWCLFTQWSITSGGKKHELLIHKTVWMNFKILSPPKSSFGFFYNILASPILIFSERSQDKKGYILYDCIYIKF